MFTSNVAPKHTNTMSNYTVPPGGRCWNAEGNTFFKDQLAPTSKRKPGETESNLGTALRHKTLPRSMRGVSAKWPSGLWRRRVQQCAAECKDLVPYDVEAAVAVAKTIAAHGTCTICDYPQSSLLTPLSFLKDSSRNFSYLFCFLF